MKNTRRVFDAMMFSYEVIRSSRKTLAVQVDIDCKITVRAPYSVSQKEIEQFLEDKKKWLEGAVVKQTEKRRLRKEYSSEQIAEMRRIAKDVLPRKVRHYSELMGVTPRSVKINSARKRYGSCSGVDNVNFSLFLMDKDERFIDYVVVHELAHIKYHNHSKDFYSFVSRFIPDYREISKKYR